MRIMPYRSVAVALSALAITQTSAAQDPNAEARAILRAWQALDAQAEPGPWDDYKNYPIVGAVWQHRTTTGDQLWIDQKDLIHSGGAITFWLRGEHSGNAKVKHRTSMWRLRIYCSEQTVSVLAISKYAADGTPIEERDYPHTRSTAIRPDTIYSDIAEKLCP